MATTDDDKPPTDPIEPDDLADEVPDAVPEEVPDDTDEPSEPDTPDESDHPDESAVDTTAPSRRGPARAGVVVALLCGVLGFALAAQLQNSGEEAQFASARQSDLVRILDELNAREERLRSEIADLENRRRNITSETEGSQAALADAQRRSAELGILAGTLPAQGPGLVITLTESGGHLPADVVLDAVEELRGAGAEALQISGAGGPTVRIAASTYFVDDGDGIEVDGATLRAPYTLTVIGDPPTMDAALKIPGGVVDTVRGARATARVQQRPNVMISAVRSPTEPRYARPAQ